MSVAEPIPKPKRKLGPLWIVTIIVVAITLLLLAGYGTWRSRASAELEAQLEKIRERGEPVWFSDLEPAPIDPKQDGWPLLKAALNKMQHPDATFYAVYDAARGYDRGGKPPVARKIAPGPADHPEFRQALAANQEAFDLLRQATARPYCRVPRDYSRLDLGATEDTASRTRTLGHLLAADILQSLGAGDHERAIAAVDELLQLSYSLREDPVLVSQFVRTTHGWLAIEGLEYVLAETDLTSQQFAELDARLAALQATVRLKPAMIAERAASLSSMDMLSKQVGVGPYFSKPIRTEEQAFLLDIMTQMADNADTLGPAGVERQQQIGRQVRAAPARFTLVTSMLRSVTNTRSAGLRFRQVLTNARLALRVDRYRAEHGQLPEKLDGVLDASMPKLPAGNFSGKPLVYRADGEGFTIYAVASNGKDDGGGMQPDDEEGGTAVEVRYDWRRDGGDAP